MKYENVTRYHFHLTYLHIPYAQSSSEVSKMAKKTVADKTPQNEDSVKNNDEVLNDDEEPNFSDPEGFIDDITDDGKCNPS